MKKGLNISFLFLILLLILSFTIVSAQENNTQELCEYTHGQWIDNECNCSDIGIGHSIGFDEEAGCVSFVSPEEITTPMLLWMFPEMIIKPLLFLGIILLVIYVYYYGDKNKKMKNLTLLEVIILTILVIIVIAIIWLWLFGFPFY